MSNDIAEDALGSARVQVLVDMYVVFFLKAFLLL